jgi:formate dehydrogenase subunit gamma
MPMTRCIQRLLLTAAVLFGCAAHAQTAPPAADPAAAPKGPPAGFVAPAEPKPDENNAQRAKTQPLNNAPFWRAVRESGKQEGTVNLPGAEKGVLVQPFVQYPGSRYTNAGEAWRQSRNNWIIPYGGSLILIVAVALGLFYWRKGKFGGHEPNTGRLIERFTYLERVAHWTVAITFVILAVSGLTVAFGKFVLLPVLGASLFGWLAYLLKTLHNLVGPLFSVALVIFAIIYVKDNIPRGYDFTWLKKGGGMLGGDEVPSHRFNAGEKLVFWGGVIALGLTVSATGLVLHQIMLGVDIVRGNMQVAHLIHATASILMMAMFLLHIYMGTIGMDGAYQAMKTGVVDEGWAKEHHGLWHDDIKAGKIPAQRTKPAAPGLGAASPQA